MPTDQELDPTFAAEAASATSTVKSFFYYHDPQRKEVARNILRQQTEYDRYQSDDGAANVILESIWNALLGN